MIDQTNRADPVATACRIWSERYADSRVLFLAGSVLRGEDTPTSDLDVVVVYERLPNAYREAFTFDGWPVEAFVHDPETLSHFFQKELPERIPSLMRMVVEGIEIPESNEVSSQLKSTATALLEAGPPRLSGDDLSLVRYRLTDWIDDIRYPRSDEELVASGTRLYHDVADFFFRTRNVWSAHSKTIPRRLREVDADFTERFLQAFDALFADKSPAPVIALVEEILKPFGGLLFDGFKRNARSDERKAADPSSEPP